MSAQKCAFQRIFKQTGDPLEKKISKKSHNAEKLKGDPSGISTSILPQNIKKLKGGPWEEKSHSNEKN